MKKIINRQLFLVIGLWCSFSLIGMAASSKELALEKEVTMLLHEIEHSGCTFIRNEEPHDGKEAAEHLNNKYQYGLGRIKTAEQFIEHIASKSYFSEKPYQVACPDKATMTSNQWLTQELMQYRQKMDKLKP